MGAFPKHFGEKWMQMYTLRVLYTIAGSVYFSRNIFFLHKSVDVNLKFSIHIYVYMYKGDGTRQLFSSCKIEVQWRSSAPKRCGGGRGTNFFFQKSEKQKKKSHNENVVERKAIVDGANGT